MTAQSHLQQHVVHLPQKRLILLIPLNRPFGHLDQTQLWATDLNYPWAPPTLARSKGLGARGQGEGPHVIGRLQQRRPLHFGYHTRHEVRVELHRDDADLGSLQGGGVWLGRDRSLAALSLPGNGRPSVPRAVPRDAAGIHGVPPLARASSANCG